MSISLVVYCIANKYMQEVWIYTQNMSQAEQFAQAAEKIEGLDQINMEAEGFENVIEHVQEMAENSDLQPQIKLMQLELMDAQSATVVLVFDDGSVIDPHTMNAYEDIFAAKMQALGDLQDLTEENPALRVNQIERNLNDDFGV